MNFCPECGTKQDVSNKFCPSCGIKIKIVLESDYISQPLTINERGYIISEDEGDAILRRLENNI